MDKKKIIIKMNEIKHRLFIWKEHLRYLRTQEKQALKKKNYFYASKHQMQADALESCIKEIETILVGGREIAG